MFISMYYHRVSINPFHLAFLPPFEQNPTKDHISLADFLNQELLLKCKGSPESKTEGFSFIYCM